MILGAGSTLDTDIFEIIFRQNEQIMLVDLLTLMLTIFCTSATGYSWKGACPATPAHVMLKSSA